MKKVHLLLIIGLCASLIFCKKEIKTGKEVDKPGETNSLDFDHSAIKADNNYAIVDYFYLLPFKAFDFSLKQENLEDRKNLFNMY